MTRVLKYYAQRKCLRKPAIVRLDKKIHLILYKMRKTGNNEDKYIRIKEVQMEDIDLKNMVILKDLPSNLVKEAYVVFKSNKMIKKFQKINKNSEKEQINKDNEDNKYAIKEAEMLVMDYIEKTEKSEKEVILNSRINKRLKKYAYIASIIMIIQFILLIVK